MRKMCRYVFMAFLLYSAEASAFIIPPCPICPSVDFIDDAIETGKGILEHLRTVADDIQTARDEFLNELKSLQNFIGLSLSESPLQKQKGMSDLALSKEIAECKVADIKDAKSVSQAFDKLFSEYPEDLFEKFPMRQREGLAQRYENKRLEFTNDAILDLQVSITDFLDNRLPAIEAETETLSNCYVKGLEEDSAMCESASASDEELGNRSNQYKLMEALRTQKRLREAVTALSGQYEAGRALQNGVRPINEDIFERTDLKGSMNDEMYYTFERHHAFAQQSSGLARDENEPERTTVRKQEETSVVRKVENPLIALEPSVPFKKHTPFEGAEDQMKALPVLDGIYDMLSEALKLHNTRQQLPEARKPFIQYEQMKALYDVSVEKLVESELGVEKYLENFYDSNDAKQMWFGKGCNYKKVYMGKKCPNIKGCTGSNGKGSDDYEDYYEHYIVCPKKLYSIVNHEEKNGLSGMAVSAYGLSKADQILNEKGDLIGHLDKDGKPVLYSGEVAERLQGTGAIVNAKGENIGVVSRDLNATAEGVGTEVVDLDQDTTMPDADAEVSVPESDNELASPSAEEEAEASIREQNINRWNIGAYIAKLIGEDLEKQIIGRIANNVVTVIDDKGNVIGYLDSDGEAFDFVGNRIGKREKGITVVDGNGNDIGNITRSVAVAVDKEGKVIGYLDEEGNVLGHGDKKIGEQEKSNNILDDDNHVIGSFGVLKETAVDEDKNVIGYISGEDEVFNTKGEKIGERQEDGSVLDENDNVIAQVGETAQMVTDKDENIIGYFDGSSNVFDFEGHKVGVREESPNVIDNNNQIIGYVTRTVETVVDEKGKVIGYVIKKEAFDFADNQIGTVLESTRIFDGNNQAAWHVSYSVETVANDNGEIIGYIDGNGAYVSKDHQIGKKVDGEDGIVIDVNGLDYLGTLKKRYPLWGDDKRFYYQYVIKGKYPNELTFLDSPRPQLAIFDLALTINGSIVIDPQVWQDIVDEIHASYDPGISACYANASKNHTSTAPCKAQEAARDAKIDAERARLEQKLEDHKNQNGQQIQTSMKRWLNEVEKYEKNLKEQVSTLQVELHTELAARAGEFRHNLKVLQDNRDNIIGKIDQRLAVLNERKSAYNDLLSALKDAQEGQKSEQENKKRIEETKRKNSSYVTKLDEKAESRRKRYVEEEKTLKSKVKSAESGLKGFENEIKKLRKDLKKIDKDIKKLRNDYAKKTASYEDAKRRQIQNALQNRSAVMPLMTPDYFIGATSTIGSVYTQALALWVPFMANAVIDVGIAIAQMVELDISGILYRPESYGVVKAVHDSMITAMENGGVYFEAKAPIDELLVSNEGIVGQAAKICFGSIFGDSSTYKTEDGGYNVTIVGMTADFVAPKRIADKRRAPVREIFHFDGEDYDAIVKSDGLAPVTTSFEILNPLDSEKGKDIPDIWLKILGPQGLGELDVDIDAFLTPIIVSLPVEPFLNAKGERPKSLGSELGVMFTYHTGKGIGMREPMYNLANYLDWAQTHNVKEEELRETEKKLLTRNVIGDYLKFVDIEKSYRTSVDQLKVKVDEGRRSIEEAMEKIKCDYKHKGTGYITDEERTKGKKVVSTEYIADQETYDAIAKCLRDGKRVFVDEAEKMMSLLPPELSDYVIKRKTKLDNIIAALKTDDDTLVFISDNTIDADSDEEREEALKAFQKEIATKETDRKATGKYDKKAQEEFEKQLDQFEEPFHARYF